MKVYINEFPKICLECPCCNQDVLSGEYFCSLGCEINSTATKKLGSCPLQSLSDYTKQVRKEMCEEIRNKIEQAKLIYEWKGKEITIEEILEQIQGENND